jgi:membrane protease subunit HflC
MPTISVAASKKAGGGSGSGGVVAADGSGKKLRLVAILLGAGLALWALIGSCFTVDVTEYAVVTRFSRITRVSAKPGLHMKAPFDSLVRLDKRILISRPPALEFLTSDKKHVVVASLATWRIADPRRFLETVGTRPAAEARIADVVLSEIGEVMGRYEFASLITANGAGDRFLRMISEIRNHAAQFTLRAYGIELVDVDIRRLLLPEQNKVHVFDRMTAERGKIAARYRSQGELEAKEITARADREKADIDARAYARVQRLRAEGDAQAARVYAAAFSRDVAFYKFLRVLRAYRQFLDKKTILFLPARAEALGLLRYELNRQSGGALPRTTARRLAADPRPAMRQGTEGVP